MSRRSTAPFVICNVFYIESVRVFVSHGGTSFKVGSNTSHPVFNISGPTPIGSPHYHSPRREFNTNGSVGYKWYGNHNLLQLMSLSVGRLSVALTTPSLVRIAPLALVVGLFCYFLKTVLGAEDMDASQPVVSGEPSSIQTFAYRWLKPAISSQRASSVGQPLLPAMAFRAVKTYDFDPMSGTSDDDLDDGPPMLRARSTI